jgi:aldose sugar dehydrogenase
MNNYPLHPFLSRFRRVVSLTAALVAAGSWSSTAQDTGPQLVDRNLQVRAVVTNLAQPTTMGFIGPDDLLVLEKASGKVQRVTGGAVSATVLDLAVNSASERGLLGIALHPQFPANPGVYLFWTESTTGADTTVLAETPLLGNRVDRFVWNGAVLNSPGISRGCQSTAAGQSRWRDP